MKGILEDIKTGELKQAYLLYGEEAYLRRQYRDKLKDALSGGADDMNSHYFEGKDINCGEIIDLAETLPFLAERRVITIENSGLFKKGGEAIAEYLASPSESTYFIFVEAEIDKRSRLYKAVQKLGRVEEFAVQDENTLKRWILGMVKKEEKKISEQTLNLFLEKAGTDMENIRKELEKLFCYTLEQDVITGEDVEAVCTHRISSQIFEMINAIADKKQKKALDLYYDLLTLKEPPMRILFLIARQFNLLMQVKELKGKGYDNKSIGEKTGLHGFVVGKYVAQCSRFKMPELKQAVTACVEAEEAVKTGKMTDRLSVELLIVRYSA
ncbi:MAG: DNA polymerase III subunit delta [Lachnospiraceae bacterium]|nr:DNA polymerase III subunit delta [Lachnospiraceae bacterium]